MWVITMIATANGIDLASFFPSDQLVISNVSIADTDITIKLKSITKQCKCPSCGIETTQSHGTYVRKVQDLPILGKRTNLLISAHEYQCLNPDCPVSTFVETYDGFLNYYSRMTERCTMLITAIAVETSCEGCARICNAMGIKTSGDSVIRLLIRRFEQQGKPPCPDVIGIDDFAFRKRCSYGTVIVDGDTHRPIDLLDGRDGKTLQQWLQNNKHIRTVTRDRASAYAKVISEELPDAMQIADRFHLYQNLLEAVRNAISRSLPPVITISNSEISSTSTVADEEPGKKNRDPCGKLFDQ